MKDFSDSHSPGNCRFIYYLSLLALVGVGFVGAPGFPRPGQAPSTPKVVLTSDLHSIALWLFDEPQYPNMTLTDAGPYQNDLRLDSPYVRWWQRTEGKGEPEALPLHIEGKAGLMSGKYGRALKLPVGPNGEVRLDTNRLGRYGATSFINGGPEGLSERFNFGYIDWTLEFWFRATEVQPARGFLFELRNETGNRRARPAVNSLQ